MKTPKEQIIELHTGQSIEEIEENNRIVEELITNKKNQIKMTNWQSIETAPKDGLILIAWCSNASGILEYDIVAFRHPQKYGDALKSTPGVEEYEGQFSKFLYPKRGYTILGWMPLPAFP